RFCKKSLSLMVNFPLPRIYKDDELTSLLLPYCRIKKGSVWKDPNGMHKIASIDAADSSSINKFLGKEKAALAIQDPPYNFVAFKELNLKKFIEWCRCWIENTFTSLAENSSLYIWLGADQTNHFEPFAEFVQMMKSSGFASKSFITMRNQRGYGTQKNWMSIRQELLYYAKGKPYFNINSEYTDIPKILKGYYKKVNGQVTENLQRSKSNNIRAGNVWIDIQQVFYRMEENVNGCYAQKPLKAIDRIINASSKKGDIVIDFFTHSGTTLLSCERNGRKCFTSDLDPVFCEITLRRLENFRKNKKTGWQNSNPFADEIMKDKKLKNYLAATFQKKEEKLKNK
ncbi:MAG TPA: site-specific DNA-methyltransferase, partial [Ignavibacteriaceae bacterium]|nr:site-specific DNA-methyltransferase [Ignavibacteriaceae bacterium]